MLVCADVRHRDYDKLQRRVVAAEDAMREMMEVAKKADAEIEQLRGALTDIGELASRNGPADHIRALNMIEGRAKTVLSETR